MSQKTIIDQNIINEMKKNIGKVCINKNPKYILDYDIYRIESIDLLKYFDGKIEYFYKCKSPFKRSPFFANKPYRRTFDKLTFIDENFEGKIKIILIECDKKKIDKNLNQKIAKKFNLPENIIEIKYICTEEELLLFEKRK